MSGRTRAPTVLEDYANKMPFRFTGTLTKFAVALEPLKLSEEEQERLRTQLPQTMAPVQ
jgi:hypothetical protein